MMQAMARMIEGITGTQVERGLGPLAEDFHQHFFRMLAATVFNERMVQKPAKATKPGEPPHIEIMREGPMGDFPALPEQNVDVPLWEGARLMRRPGKSNSLWIGVVSTDAPSGKLGMFINVPGSKLQGGGKVQSGSVRAPEKQPGTQTAIL